MGVRSEPSQRKVAQLFRRRREENTKMKHLALLSMVTLASCAPQSLVVTTTGPPCVDDEYDEGCIEVNNSTISTTTTTTTSTTTLSTTTTTEKLVATEPLETTKFHIKSEFQFRYARTVVESAVSNPDTVAQVGSFSLVIPDSAFISAFSMEMDGEEFKARVEGKEEAEKTFEKALSRGRGAGLVSQDAKDANKFTVSTNIEGGQEVVFRLTYDELLGRKEGMYRQEINIDPQQIVEDFRVEVFINESLPITEVNVPELLQSNSIDPSEETQNSFVTIDRDFEGDAKKARIVFAPTAIEQRAAAEEGMSGRLQINYDVDRKNQGSHYFHHCKEQPCQNYYNNYFLYFYHFDNNQPTGDLPIDALLQDLQPRRGVGTFGRLRRSGFLLRRRHLSPGGGPLLLATLRGGQLWWTQCMGEAGGRLQGDGQLREGALPGGVLSQEGAVLNANRFSAATKVIKDRNRQ